MSDRVDLIVRLGAAVSQADDAMAAVLVDALKALIEDAGVIAAHERRKAKDRNRKRAVESAASTESAESMESAERAECVETRATVPPAPPSSSFPRPHITPSSPPPSASSSPAAGSHAADAEDRLFARFAAELDRVVLQRFLGTRSPEARVAWVGRLGALLDAPPHFTPAELAEGLEALMTEPEASWKPAVLKAWVRRVRSDTAREAQRATAGDSIGGGAAGAHFARIRALVQQAPRVPGQPGRRFIRRTDVEALGERALQAYDEIGGADRFLDPEEKVGFLLRDFTKAYGTLTGATP